MTVSEDLPGTGHVRLPALSSGHLAALLGVADTGSFSEAALRLGVAQSTVSHAVQSAERELGVRIFERGRHGARPTPAGLRVLTHARRAAGALQAMACGPEPEGGAELRGTLRVVSCRSVIRQFVTPALRDFARRHPGARVEVHDTPGEHDDIERMVGAGGADLGLGRLPMHAGLCARPLFADEYLILTARSAPPIRSWEDLHRAAYIVCEEDCAPHVAAHIARHSRPPRPATRLKDPNVALGMVAEGLGFTILTRLVVVPLPAGVSASPLPTPLWRTIGSVTCPARLTDQTAALARAFQETVLSPGALRGAAGGLACALRFAGPDGTGEAGGTEGAR